jgi:hypothetical protein
MAAAEILSGKDMAPPIKWKLMQLTAEPSGNGM